MTKTPLSFFPSAFLDSELVSTELTSSALQKKKNALEDVVGFDPPKHGGNLPPSGPMGAQKKWQG